MILMLSMQLLNPAVWQHRDSNGKSVNQQAKVVREIGNQIKPWINTVNAIQRWLPPGLVANSIGNASKGDPIIALESLALLGIWTLGAGGILATRLRSEYRGESLGTAPARKKAPAKARAVPTTQAYTSDTGVRDRTGEARMPTTAGSIAAIIEKEFRALLRTMPLLYAIGAPMLLMLVFSGAFLQGHGPSGHVFPYALPICVVYAQIGFIQLFYNLSLIHI